ncbi:hypothetical protein PPYR_06698 [Photinus pyralis]|uniref:Nose resistant-to-fluoxetine protein N-terminal domain-containing protein n=1 Tax=Photinus pyralis TaxID=7054 RepID=A0A5N4ANM0_PHOPY|nr:nose resistant to fluoxetine protein 6-like [Photinus pyralis]KAB0798818.1 hypothetical protein PPYR_06698 [Photinus pyralis]
MKATTLFVSALFPYFLGTRGFLPEEDIRGINHTSNVASFAFQNANLSKNCLQQLNQYVKDLAGKKMWALKMFDASGKNPSGILEGNFYELGSFDECMSIEETMAEDTIIGKYCVGKLPFGLKLGVCAPGACTARELEGVYNGTGFSFSESNCQSKESQPKIDVGAAIVISFLGMVLCWIIFSTIYDAITQQLEKVSRHWFLISFSFFTNGRKMFAISKNDDEISCLHGIRVISIMWIILGHWGLLFGRLPIRNLNFVLEFMNTPSSMILLGGQNAVDTFFLLSGLTLAYVFVKHSKKGTKLNLLVFYAHRYIRLTPAVGIMLVFHMFLLKYMGSGPLWPSIVETLSGPCEKNWWKVLLYIQNFGTMNDVCMEPTWFLSVDMQLYMVSPLLLLPLLKWPNVVLAVTACLAACSMVAGFVLTWIFNIIKIENGGVYMTYIYLPPYTRAAPWLVGIILGYLIYDTKTRTGRVVLNKVFVVAMWITALAVLITCVFAEHDLLVSTEGLLWKHGLNNALRRTAWAVAIGWVIYACTFGYGRLVNAFLSCTVFKVLSRLTFSFYLTHIFVQAVTMEGFQMNPVVSVGFILTIVWTNYAMTFFASLLLTLGFESPLIAIEKRLLRRH